MPAVAIQSMAQKAGWSKDKAERAWDQIKDSVVGAKLKSGATIPSNSDKWTDEMWAYMMGSLRNTMKGKSEAMNANKLIDRVLNGEHPSDIIEEIPASVIAKIAAKGDTIPKDNDDEDEDKKKRKKFRKK